MRKHLLFIVENNPVPTDRRVWNEVLAAKEFGYDVSVICPTNSRGKYFCECFEGIRIYRHPRLLEGRSKLGLLLEYINALFWEFILSIYIFITKRFHIIHAANPPDHIFLIALPYKLLGVKFIFDHHDIAPEIYYAKFGKKGFFYSMLIAMEKFTFKTADIVISTNESYRKVAIQRGGKKADDVFVVRNGPNLSRIPHVEPNEKLYDGFRYLVGYVGTINKQEGIENLLRAVEYIVNVKNRTDIKFIIVGDGPHRGEVVQLSRYIGLDRYVWFTGFIPDRELFEILATVNVCINPEPRNKFTDRSTMVKIMEYMTFGKPIVQFYTTEGEITAGKAALYVKEKNDIAFAEAIIALLNDPEKRHRMGAIGQKRIFELLNWDKQKENLRKAYEYLGKTGQAM